MKDLGDEVKTLEKKIKVMEQPRGRAKGGRRLVLRISLPGNSNDSSENQMWCVNMGKYMFFGGTSWVLITMTGVPQIG